MQPNEPEKGKRVGSRVYPPAVYLKALIAVKQDAQLDKDMEALKDRYLEKWCTYYLCEERQEEERRKIRETLAQRSDTGPSETATTGPVEGVLRDREEH